MLLIKPFLGCNLACKYCYERDYRKKALPKMAYNLKTILERMEEFKDLEISLHGGEALAMPKKDVVKILAKMCELKGRSAIQTNGTLINDEYIKIFKKYKTSVGISYDGPGTLSEFRPGSVNVDKIIERLIKEKLGVSLIMVLSKANAGTDAKLKTFKEYLLKLSKMGIQGRVNPCVGAPDYELDEKRLKGAYLDLARLCLENNLKWSPFIDLMHGLKSKPRVCILMGCDPFHTASATVILDDGSVTNCMRTNKEEILLRHPVLYDTRTQILSETPREFGGCKDCKYWTACYGGCPSISINDDWRNKTYLCYLWNALFQYFEKPLNFFEHPDTMSQQRGNNCEPGNKPLTEGSGWRHLDHMDQSRANTGGHEDGHGDSHGDTPHGDWQNHADK